MWQRSALLLTACLTSFAQTQIDNPQTTDTFVNLSPSNNVCVDTYVYDLSNQLIECCSSSLTGSQQYFYSARNDLIRNSIIAQPPTSILLKISASLPNGGTCSTYSPGVGSNALSVSLSPTPGGSGTPITLAAPTANDLTQCQFVQLNGSGFGICGAARTLSSPQTPSLSIKKVHSGIFVQGQSGASYAVTVSNSLFSSPTSGAVTVTESIPTGLTLASMSGSGWTCTGLGCTRSDALNPGTDYPPITVTVNVAPDAASPQINSVTVSGGGSASSTATDSTMISPSSPETVGVEIDNLYAADTFVNLSTTNSVCLNSYVFDTSNMLVACCSSQLSPASQYYLSARNDLANNTITNPANRPPSSLLLKVFASTPPNGPICHAPAPGPAASGLTASLGPTPGAPGTPLSQVAPTAHDLELCQFIEANGSGFGICRQARTLATGPSIILPVGLSVAPGEQALFPVKISTPAPSGGAFILLTLANSSVGSLSVVNVLIPEGQTESDRVRFNGLSAGVVTVSASAVGYLSASTQVTVGTGGTGPGPGGSNPPTLNLPAAISVSVGGQVVVPISLGGANPADGAFVTLSLSSPVASLNTSNVIIPSGDTTSQRLRLNGLSAGTATLTASAVGYTSVTVPVQVQ